MPARVADTQRGQVCNSPLWKSSNILFISSSIFRKAPGFERPHAKVESLLSSCRDANGQPVKVSPDFLLSPATSLTPENLSGAVRSAFDFKFVFLGSDPEAVGGGPAFYLGLGRTKVFR